MKLGDLRTPALLLRLDRVRSNLARVGELLAPHGGLARWRPHVKTAKVPEVQRMLLELGLRRFKCATTLEASVLLGLADAAGVEIDLLVAMAHRGANLRRVAELARAHARHRMSVLTEDPAHAREVRALDARLGLFVDLDPSFGRSGVPHQDRARIAAVAGACGDALRGLHSYEGHVRASTAVERASICAPLFDELADIARELRLEERETITSGTPTFVEALDHSGLRRLNHTVSPGIVVYWDLNSAALGLTGFRCAASVLARVISTPRPLRVTLDAGSKSLDAAAAEPCAELAGFSARLSRPSEEHTPVDFERAPLPAPGELVELLPRHVCPMINLATHAVLLDGERVVAVVPVAARGHESPRV